MATLVCPSIISGKHSIEDDVFIDNSSKSLAKKAKTNDIDKLSMSINKHSESLDAITKIALFQQERDCSQAWEDSISSRIDSLCDTKRNLVIQLALEEVSKNKTFADIIVKEIASIEEEINKNLGKLKHLHETPQKSNQSPH